MIRPPRSELKKPGPDRWDLTGVRCKVPVMTRKGRERVRAAIEARREISRRNGTNWVSPDVEKPVLWMCSHKQVAWLARFGVDGRNMPEAVGRAIADAYRANGRTMPAPHAVDEIVATTTKRLLDSRPPPRSEASPKKASR
jgi:hypothetical protein